MKNKLSNVKAIFAWALFDWANSAFPTIVMTFVFATYFTTHIAKNTIVGTAQWGLTVALAGGVIALLSPVFGAIADLQGRRKPWLLVLTLLLMLSAALLWFAEPDIRFVPWALFWAALGIVALEVGMVFYNAMLADLAPERFLGRISGWGWGLGYAGGLVALLLAFTFMHYHHRADFIDANMAGHIRLCGPLVAIWIAVFAWPIFVWTPDRPHSGLSMTRALGQGLNTLWQTLKSLRQYRDIVRFLLARIFYIDGLNTLFAFGGIYAVGTFHLSLTEVIQFGIAMNVAAGVGAVVFAWLDDFRGAKITLFIALTLMISAGTGLLFVQTKLHFWVLGLLVSLCVGPVQAASRSLMVRLSPKKLATEMFGLYAFSGKATAFLGPLLFAWMTQFFNSQRWGMVSVLAFLVAGTLLLVRVREPHHSIRG